jgi:formimidoylglutamate deiminase
MTAAMTVIHAKRALTPQGWQTDVRLSFEGRRIAAVVPDAPPQPGDERHAVVLPGLSNLHSHAFQRGMAGLAEKRGSSTDTFWTWREVMYRFALTMTPDQLEAVASQLYAEMLEAGFVRVGEFHYLHHDRDGTPYADIAEMATRIVAAAGETGIGLTLLPVFYAHSTFGGAAPKSEQRRFITDLDSFSALVEGSRKTAATLDGAAMGLAPHSLRAVTPEELRAVATMAPHEPIHIHAAEQVREVEDCLAWSGQRPVEWLLDHEALDGRWCLIHATHMTETETRRLATSGAVVSLCPVTEANLGDGIFPAPAFVGHGGRFGVGSDSNIRIGIPDELRQLEYSQRLAHRARNVMAVEGGSTGRALFDAALQGGSVLGAPAPGLAAGGPADLISLKPDHPELIERDADAILDGWIFAGNASVDCVWAGGRKCVENGRHHRREAIASRFRLVMKDMLAGS